MQSLDVAQEAASRLVAMFIVGQISVVMIAALIRLLVFPASKKRNEHGEADQYPPGPGEKQQPQEIQKNGPQRLPQDPGNVRGLGLNTSQQGTENIHAHQSTQR